MQWPKFLIRYKCINDLPDHCTFMCRMAPNMPFRYALKQGQVYWWFEPSGIKVSKISETKSTYIDIYLLSQK